MILRVVGALGAVIRRFLADQGFLLAAALSFAFLLCLAPLVLLLFSAMGFLLQSDEIAEYVVDTAGHLFPGYGREMLQAITLLTQERKVTGILGAVGLAVFASQLLSLTRTVTNVAFRVRKRRGLIHGFVFDLFALGTLGVVAVAVSAVILAVVTLGNLALRIAPPALLPSIRWGRLVAQPLMYLAQLGLLFLVYRTFPNTRVPAAAAAIATVTVAAFWEAARWAFGAYLEHFGVYGRLYGSLGVVVATLVWIYYSAMIFVFGAEVAGFVTERRRGTTMGAGEPPPASPPEAPAGGSRGFGYALAAVLGGVGLIGAVQNSAPTTARFLVWAIDGLPLSGLMLGAFVVGAVGAGVPFWIGRRRLRARLRELEERLATERAAVAESGRAQGSPGSGSA